VSRLQTVTIWAKNSKIIQPIIASVAIYMVEFQWKSTITCLFCPTA